MAIDVSIDRRMIADAARAAGRPHPYVAVVVPADASLHGSAVLTAMTARDRALWWQPEADLLVVGAGATARLGATAPPGADEPHRFDSVPLRELSVGVADPYETGVSPRLIGGFSFFADRTWSRFGQGELVLPAVAYVREGERAAWVVTAVSGELPDIVAVVDELESRIVSRAAAGAAETDVPIELFEPDRRQSRELIAETIEEIHAGRLEKVVIARTAAADVELDPDRIVEVLVERYPECATFAFERQGEWFVGATPELLVRKQGSAVASAAIAATAPRHADPVLDRIELDSLQTTKQLEEHRLVVEAIVAALEALDVATSISEQRVLELRRVRHLATAVDGVAPADVGILDLVGALHPTPAVGGVPGSGALDWIRSHERFVRGWYAAPVGVVDLVGDGEFRVALRSARIDGGTIHLYAGAGIVAGSDPDAEMDEIDLKLGVMAGAVAAAT